MSKTARLPVASELIDLVQLPAGFEEVWSRYLADDFDRPGVELLIAGPFPEGIVDGDRVGALVKMLAPGMLEWQWLDGCGRPVGDPLPLN